MYLYSFFKDFILKSNFKKFCLVINLSSGERFESGISMINLRL